MIYTAFLIFTFIIIAFAFYQMQYFMFFTPTYYRSTELDDRFKILSVTTEDGIELEGVVHEPLSFKATMLFFAGRSYDAVGVIEKISLAYPDIRIITFNYRSYGRSGGHINEKNIFSDALHISKVIKKTYGDIYVAGFSLGSSVASYVASKEKVLAVFLLGPFDSMAGVVKIKYGMDLSWILRYEFDNTKFVEDIDADTYIFASKDDEVTFIECVDKLKKHVKNLVCYKEFTGLRHRDILCNEEIVKKIGSVVK